MKRKQAINQTGFTLVEIMIVVAIIGLLALLSIPGFTKSRQNSFKQKCIAGQRLILAGAHLYELETGKTLASMSGDGVQIRNTLLNLNYVKSQDAFECPASQSKDYDDITLVFTNGACTGTSCSILPTEHLFR